MSYDYEGREVWLDDIGALLHDPVTYPLCERHADRVSAPQGWVITDLRRPVLELFSSRDVA